MRNRTLFPPADAADGHGSRTTAADTISGESAFGDKHSGDVVLKYRQDVCLAAVVYGRAPDNLHVERKKRHRSLGGRLHDKLVKNPDGVGRRRNGRTDICR